MYQQGSKYFAIDPLPGPWDWIKRSIFNFSEHGYVAYQIKENDECSNMQAHILSLHAPSIPGWVKGQNIFF